MIVHHRHMKAKGLEYCNPGARKWFQLHNLDWNEFVTNGLPEEVLLATNDAMAIEVVQEARKEWAAEKVAAKL